MLTCHLMPQMGTKRGIAVTSDIPLIHEKGQRTRLENFVARMQMVGSVDGMLSPGSRIGKRKLEIGRKMERKKERRREASRSEAA